MKFFESKTDFTRYLKKSGYSISSLTPDDAVKLMISFYREVRYPEVDLNNDGDMLLFQWGIFDWGKGKRFEFNVTRQFSIDINLEDDGEAEEDELGEGIWQLGLTLRFFPSPEVEMIGKSNHWCHDVNGIETSIQVLKNAGLPERIESFKPLEIELDFEAV